MPSALHSVRRAAIRSAANVRMRTAPLLVLASLAFALPHSAAAKDAPSRPPIKGCAWEKLSDARLGLEAWVSRCDFGFRKIDFVVKGDSLAIRFSDGGGVPDPVVDVFALEGTESPEAGLRRIFAAKTEKPVASRCVLAPYQYGTARPGIRRFTFVPDAAYAKEVAAKARPDEIGEPPCGPWGKGPEGVQYFELQEGVRKVLFVRVGQEDPLFDEGTLRLLPPR
jgi:hypothetical protein